jgi:hypothetical protein
LKLVTSFLLSLSIFCLHAQIKTLIPKDEEINLPNNDESKIGLSTTLDETVIQKDKIVKLFSNHIINSMNSEYYHLLDSGENYIELFVIYPCKSFNLKDIQAHQIINEGIITSTILIKFNDSTYDIHLKDYNWINKNKKGTSIDEIYRIYRKNDNLTYKLQYYGILKSCEYSIAESLSNIMVVIDEVMKGKG